MGREESMNDNIFDFEDTQNESNDEDLNLIDFEEDESGKESTDTNEDKTEGAEETKENDTIDNTSDKKETTDEEELDEEELDIDALLAELDSEIKDSNTALDNIEENSTVDSADISALRDSLKKAEDFIKKLSNEKSDLKFRNAELESYSIENSDPKVLTIVKNLERANNGDDKAKSRVINTLKDMLYDLTGEDIESKKVNNDIDMLTASEMYNNEINPNIKFKKEQEDIGIMV